MTAYRNDLGKLKLIQRGRNTIQQEAKAYLQFTETNKSYTSEMELNNKHP